MGTLRTVLPNGKEVFLESSKARDLPRLVQDLLAGAYQEKHLLLSAVQEIATVVIPEANPALRALQDIDLRRSCRGGPDLAFQAKSSGLILVQAESPLVTNATELRDELVGFQSSAIIIGEPDRPIIAAYLIAGRSSSHLDFSGLWTGSVPLSWLSWDDVAARVVASSTSDEHRFTVLLEVLVEQSRKLLSELARQPQLLEGIDDRRFEELLATLLADVGFDDVELTPPRKDGGNDIIARHRNTLTGNIETYLFECKHWVSGEKVTARWAAALLDVVAASGATAGVLVSSSGFGRRLIEHQISLRPKLYLKDRSHIVGWFSAWERLYGELLVRTIDPIRELVLTP